MLDPDHRVLLMKIETPNGWVGWITPGGGIEVGEDLDTALARELREETGQTEWNNRGLLGHRKTQFPWRDKLFLQEEFIFAVQSPHFQVSQISEPDEMEKEGFREFRWWSLKDLQQTREQVAPANLSTWLEFFLSQGLPAHPFEERKLSMHSLSSPFVLAPLTNGQSLPDGSLGEDEFRWLESRAKGGYGMIISCAANVLPEGQGWNGELGVFSDLQKPGLQRLAQMIKDHGSLGMVQIFDGGAKAPSSVTGRQPRSCVSFREGQEDIREMSPDEIEKLVDAFVMASRRVVDCGWHGVELHGANGYIFTQFLNSQLNTRRDKWGGSLENRQRLLVTTLQRLRQTLGSESILGLRVSPEYWNPTTKQQVIPFRESMDLIDRLNELELDYLHLSMRRFDAKPEDQSVSEPLVSAVRGRLRSRTSLIVAGGVRTPEDARHLMNLGSDFVALGTGAILNPLWPKRFHETPQWVPEQGPLPKARLVSEGLSESFVEYLKRFPQSFVER
jgi:2,4-dienoyl-CoA reductase-like NADH-dependent reductase (Old Yellow Enzyme family)/ADP-ribose pyrophosphatase YjhB (NUDIX family)